MSDVVKTDIKYLPGVGAKRAEILYKELNISTFGDMLYTFPFRYIDRTRFYTVKEINADLPYIQLTGKIISANIVSGAKRQKRLVLTFADGTGEIDLVFFQGLKWIQDKYRMGVNYIVFGKPSLFNGELNLVHPEIELPEEDKGKISTTIQGIYSSTEALRNNYLGNKAFVKLMVNLLTAVQGRIEETLPDYILEQYRLLPLSEALLNIHFPLNADLLHKARHRLKFEELFYIQLNMLRQRSERWQKKNGFTFSTVGQHFNTFYSNNLKFELTGAQKRVVREIRRDMGSSKQMNRLLQGDVGSGKTLVALLCMLIAVDNGFQACIMAPTEILATQHYESIISFLKGMDVNVGLLTGSTKKAERNRLAECLMDGSLHILIGTHALIEDTVQFKNLGFVVIDEQHRFGVEQRAKLWTKNEHPPHVLVMTATPIPRTLAMTLYGDLDVSVIDELPPGRKPIQTLLFNDSKRLRLFAFMKEQIKQGRQIYMVYPLIKESEKMDYKDLEDGYESITRAFPPPEYVTTVVHGKMKPADKDYSMRLFVTGKAHIMVATSVIEVGVNVPNATVMVIESAERFGLSQLHQLRGRVGRGGEQSYCILMAGYKLSNESKKRLELMVQTNDGFEIAEADLKLRGPGDLEGTQQSGLPINLRITDLSKDGKLLEYVRDVAQTILDDDSLLSKEKNKILCQQLDALQPKRNDFREIS